MSSGLCQQLWSESPSPICYTTPYTPNHQSINQTSKQASNQAINCQGNALLVPKHSGKKVSSISSKILLKEDIRFRNHSSNSIVEGQQTLDKTTKTCKSFEEMGCIPRQRGHKAQGGL
jgi:hypothetical protein